jgi:hypothetical protein
MFLYAPAHMGAIIPELIKDGFGLLGSIGTFLHTTLRNRYQAIDDLEVDSRALAQLRQFQEEALKEPGSSRYPARKVIWASDERVVHNDFFPGDPDPEEIPKTDHQSVCKPRPGLPERADALLSAL